MTRLQAHSHVTGYRGNHLRTEDHATNQGDTLKRYIAKHLRQLAEESKMSQHQTRRRWRLWPAKTRGHIASRMPRFHGDRRSAKAT